MDAKPVMAGTDGSEASLRAVEWAAREAVLHQTALRIVSAPELPAGMSPYSITRENVAGVVQQATRRMLADAAQRAAQLEPGLTVDTKLLSGPPAHALLDTATEASMLVVGSRGAGGFAAMLLGSVGRYVATRASCPVVVSREETMAVHRKVVLGIRDPERCAAALGFAFEEAALRHARVLAVHAWTWNPPGVGWAGRLADAELAGYDPYELPATMTARLDEVLAAWRDKYPGVQAGWEAVFSDPGRALVGASTRADLVVIGRHVAGTGVGSVIHSVLAHAHAPIAIIPGD